MNKTHAIHVSSVSLKAAMAASGLLMAGWLTLHMAGNLAVFAGAEVMNGYALKLRATGLLWPMRLGLLALLVTHVAGAAVTSRRSLAARPIRYHEQPRSLVASLASRSMRLGGLLLGAYVIYHVAHVYGIGHADFIPGDVHHNLVSILASPVHASLYAAASLLTALHLAHGLSSALRSLGLLDGQARERRVVRALHAWAWLVGAGFSATALILCAVAG